ncbi:MAG: pyruvate dehydrogenase complex dihydrolipoamide acetyltransferase [Spirochaetales bacterium]
MAERIPMIALSPTMEEGRILTWKVKPGDEVRSGTVLCEVETDKASMEYESPTEGTLLKILRQEGESVKIGEPIAWIGKPGEQVPDEPVSPEGQEPSKSAGKEEVAGVEIETPAAEAAPPSSLVPPAGGSLKSSPLARKLAYELGIDIRRIPGSGPGGRVVKRDVLRFQEAAGKGGFRGTAALSEGPSAESAPRMVASDRLLEDREVPVSGMRTAIAKRLSESFFTAPHYFLRMAVRMDPLMDARSRFNAEGPEKLSLNAFFIKLAAEAIRRHPQINTTWKGTVIQYHGSIDIGLAVALPDGLITPVVRNCGEKGVREIDQELTDLIEKAKKGSLKPEEYTHATFTISNLGNYGIEEFTAIINPPGSAILALGAIRKEPVVNDRDEIEIQRILRVTLSCDHRTIDGAVGAAFLRDLKGMMEDPFRALL